MNRGLLTFGIITGGLGCVVMLIGLMFLFCAGALAIIGASASSDQPAAVGNP